MGMAALDNAMTDVISGRLRLRRMTSLPTKPVAPATMSFMFAKYLVFLFLVVFDNFEIYDGMSWCHRSMTLYMRWFFDFRFYSSLVSSLM